MNEVESLLKQEIIGYKGEVTVDLMKGDKFIKRLAFHNEGNGPLFQYLMHCLAGAFEPLEVPSYLRIFDSNDNELTLRAISKTGTPSYEFESDKASAVITFNVPATALRQNTGLRVMKLYSQSNLSRFENYSASFDLGEDKSITSGTNLIVAWKMIVGNANTGE